MKKVLFAIVAIAAIFAFSSCSKSCKCTAKFNGEVLSETTVKLSDGEKCSDYNGRITILGQTAENKCVPQLF
jgi:hypothetical protein